MGIFTGGTLLQHWLTGQACPTCRQPCGTTGGGECPGIGVHGVKAETHTANCSFKTSTISVSVFKKHVGLCSALCKPELELIEKLEIYAAIHSKQNRMHIHQ